LTSFLIPIWNDSDTSLFYLENSSI